MPLSNTDYLGKAVGYPISLISGSVKPAAGSAVIVGSLAMILTTPKGSREMLPDYGSQIDELLWEPNDEVLDTLLRTYIVDAVNKWESRIKLIDVSIVSKGSISLCRLVYKILAFNRVESFVFPFSRKPLPY